jgi:uncharacterized protein
MKSGNSFDLRKYDFDNDLFSKSHDHYTKGLWPIVYILSNEKIRQAYVGETTDAFSRMDAHLKNDDKNKLAIAHFITSAKFNKSATLDIESNLIKYISGDGQYDLLNLNIGLANHIYYQNEIYWEMFKSIWDKLRSEGIAKHSIAYIDNSDLFKYSPYKSLTNEQRSGLLTILKNLLKYDSGNIVVNGGAGTGKTILAVFLFKLLNSKIEGFSLKEFGDEEDEFIQVIVALKNKYPDPKMALVVPMASFRNTLKKVFKNVKGLNAGMVIGPAEIAKSRFDIVLVDESHRLRRRVNLGTYFGAFDRVCEKLKLDKTRCSELDWILKQSDNAIFFYDENQSVKPSDIKRQDFDKLRLAKSSRIENLKSQFRVKGGDDYVNYIDKLLNVSLGRSKMFNSDYEFLLFDSIEEMVREIHHRDEKHGLSRLIAGYSWPWVSKKNKEKPDIKIDNTELRWNRLTVDWVNSEGAINEVGCIHTTQGYDLNYAGIIFGNEITYDKEKNKIVILKENYFDINGKQSINDPEELKQFILNIYKTIMLRGIKGTYVYVCDQNLREYFAEHIARFKTEKTPVYLHPSKVIPFVNSIPVYDLRAAAGSFSKPKKVTDCEWIALPNDHKPSKELFACRVEGESMNRVIKNGSICLFRKYSGGSRNGAIVLVESTDIQDPDSGSGYTVKEYWSKKEVGEEGWRHESITLKPLSHNPEYKDIEVKEDEINSLKVIGVFVGVLA